MQVLLDTHALLWFLLDDPKLSRTYPFTPPAQIRSNLPLTPTLSPGGKEFKAGGVNGYSRTARAIISDAQTKVSVSPATFWEIAIKISLGKYTLAEPYEVFIEQELARNDFGILPILPRHTAILIDLPFHHRDPFDRLLIAQAIAEQIPLVSCDEVIDHYMVTRLW